MGPSRPAWMSEAQARAIEALGATTDPAHLAEIALTELSPPELLADALFEMSPWVARKVLASITDPAALARVYRRMCREDHVTTQYALKGDLVRTVLTSLKGHDDVLGGILDDPSVDEYYRVLALRELTDLGPLPRLAHHDPSPRVRLQAAMRLGDETLVASLIPAVDPVWTHDAIRLVESPELLTGLVVGDQGAPYVSEVLTKITSVAVLERIAAQASEASLAEAVAGRLRGFVCRQCGHDTAERPVRQEICVCPACGQANHDFVRQSTVIEHRDYESGSRWEECSRCGAQRNYESVNTM